MVVAYLGGNENDTPFKIQLKGSDKKTPFEIRLTPDHKLVSIVDVVMVVSFTSR